MCSLTNASAWSKFNGLEVIAARPPAGLPGALICRPFHWETTLTASGMPYGRGMFPNANPNLTGTSDGNPLRKKKYAGPPILLLNYVSASAPSPGSVLTGVRAARVDAGVISGGHDAATNVVYDCGVECRPPASFAEALARAEQQRAAQSGTAH